MMLLKYAYLWHQFRGIPCYFCDLCCLFHSSGRMDIFAFSRQTSIFLSICKNAYDRILRCIIIQYGTYIFCVRIIQVSINSVISRTKTGNSVLWRNSKSALYYLITYLASNLCIDGYLIGWSQNFLVHRLIIKPLNFVMCFFVKNILVNRVYLCPLCTYFSAFDLLKLSWMFCCVSYRFQKILLKFKFCCFTEKLIKNKNLFF